ncbi:MAG TPA: hypothetical protein PKC39_14530 [Ferruginibacter sp.]|nr:hypothetical protein [Ferruginibacter sp.]HMP22172.1 hypothetical protein [Ferruginibacter sp.]
MKKETQEEKAARERYEKEVRKEKEIMEAVAKRHNVAKVLMLKVPLNDEYSSFKYGFLKYPEREDVSIAMSLQNTDPLRGKQIVMENNWLEGDREIINDTELFLSACTALDEVLSIRQSIVKKNY